MKANKSSENIFVLLLEMLHVKHTKTFSNKYFNENPYKNSLYGISKVLSDYNVENQGIRVKDKEKALSELPPPFVAYVNNDFVIVYHADCDNVKYIWKNKKISVSTGEFKNNWSGVVLLAEADENSTEPHYKKHRNGEIFSAMKYTALISACILILSIAGFYTQLYNNFNLMVALLINISGIYISYLLVLKQLNISNHLADKICSLLIHQNDCNNMLESDAAKFFGFSWSEIGLGYFSGNIIMLFFLPSYYPYAAILNICTLPYTLWSVWYQRFKAKQWCPLCLIVLGILWILFFYNLFSGLIYVPEFEILNILLTGCIYVTPVLVLNIFNSIRSEAKNKEKVSFELNSLKSNGEIFSVLIKEKPKYEVDKTVSTILLGNPDSRNLVKIVSNPHCNPCARLHKKLKHLLQNGLEEYCIQYVLTSFNKSLEDSNRLIIAMYRKMELPDFLSFLDEWYDYGRHNKDKIFRKYPFDNENRDIQEEFDRHKRWINKTKIRSTPTILFNGYEYPQNIYRIEDLLLLSDIEIS